MGGAVPHPSLSQTELWTPLIPVNTSLVLWCPGPTRAASLTHPSPASHSPSQRSAQSVAFFFKMFPKAAGRLPAARPLHLCPIAFWPEPLSTGSLQGLSIPSILLSLLPSLTPRVSSQCSGQRGPVEDTGRGPSTTPHPRRLTSDLDSDRS